MQNNAGQVVGVSQRFTPTGLNNGRDAWIWNGSSTLQIGLTGANYTGSAGYQTSDALRQNEAGQVVGISFRYTGLSTSNGQDAWVWNGSSTVRVGMSGPGYTGSAGYQFSNIRSQNSVGQVVGVSNRYTGVRTAVGQDAWYYDPIAQTSIAMIGSVRASDNYSFSECGVLTQGGFLLGNYTFFRGGAGPGEQRAFIFRPDLGFTDLGNLVSGGLTLSGWQSLRNPIFTDALNTIVGYGYVNGQTSGQSVFVMTIPTPGITLVVCVGGWLAATRRRVKQLRAASQLATTVS
jgi:hypothetical protein